MLASHEPRWSSGWNFGPIAGEELPVARLVEEFIAAWGSGTWQDVSDPHQLHEASVLRLCIDKALWELGWSPRWNVREAVARTAHWFQAYEHNDDLRTACLQDIADYERAGAPSMPLASPMRETVGSPSTGIASGTRTSGLCELHPPATNAVPAPHQAAQSAKARPDFDCERLRRTVLHMAYTGSTCHVACAFSLIEMLAVLHRNHLRYPDDDNRHPHRDYLVLSKGHGVLAQYACMYERGWLTDDEVNRYAHDGTRLKGLSDAHIPGLEVTSGSLGHGLSVGVGLALAAKRRGTDQRVFAIVGDGEINEGAIWEATLFAAQFELSNLIIIVDANGFQAMGPTDEVMRLGDIAEKFAAFDCEALTVDGHDEQALDVALGELVRLPGRKPRVLVANTVKGHGVTFMAGDNRWHYTRMPENVFQQAMGELQPSSEVAAA